ncbi:MAG: hypothetical protein K2I89_07080 [Muribaculaceae bacterium]|nr:hypothetical protein [Muribaculaceae bacterium]
MPRALLSVIVLVLSVLSMESRRQAIVVDSLTRLPLASASLFDRDGNMIGVSGLNGRLPLVYPENYPLTLRYLGYKEKTIPYAVIDTIFLQENIAELPEFIVESREHRVLHMLAYVREYSTLSTYTDTVFLFREKMVDYMLPADKKTRFKGWTRPRIIKTKSYYRFTNSQGVDSVSDECGYHFSWSDWMSVAPLTSLPASLKGETCASDTVFGKYSPTEIWIKNADRVIVDVNVLADTTSRKWVPDLSGFFRNELDFENFRVRYNYDNVGAETVSPVNLTGYSFSVESNGRGRNMFMFNRINEPFFVSTYAEVYIIDKEYITVKEAKKWANHNFKDDEVVIYQPSEAPDLNASVYELIERVNSIDKGKIRLDVTPDERLIAKNLNNNNFRLDKRFINILKDITGISAYRTNRNFKRSWNDFLRDQKQRNKSHHTNE